MEIASVLPFGVAAGTSGSARAQPTDEPFHGCLGSAVASGQKVQPRASEAREARDGVALAEPETARSRPEPEDEQGPTGAVPAAVAPPARAVPASEPAVSLGAAGEAAEASPPAPQPSPPAQAPSVMPPPVPKGADPGVALGAPPTETAPPPGEALPIPKLPVEPQPAVAQPAAPAPDPVPPPAPAPDPVTSTTHAAVASEPETAPVRTGQSRGRLGAERLWGYWLRHGGGGVQRPEVASSAAAQVVPHGEDPAEAVAAPGGEVATRQATAETAVVRTGAGPGSETVAGAESGAGPRAEPTAVDAPANPDRGSAHGLERAARTGPAAPRDQPPAPQPPHQIANAVRMAVQRGGSQVTVQLEPEALGKVQVVLVHGEEGVRASFRVENPLTHQSLQADAPLLKQALEARGVNVAHISVELDQGDRQGRDPLAHHARGRRRHFGGAEDSQMQLDDLPLRAQQWRPWGFEARA